MAKKSSQNKNVINYLFFTVIVLLVTVSLLSLFVFKYTNLVSDKVLGASTVSVNKEVAFSRNLTCGMCAVSSKSMVIVLQKDGTNSKSWGARCVSQEVLAKSTYIAYLTCPSLTPASGLSPTTALHLKTTLTITPRIEKSSR